LDGIHLFTTAKGLPMDRHVRARPILATGMARSGGSWVAKMLVEAGGAVHINEPLNRLHPPGLSPGILRVPRPVSYQYIAEHNDADFGPGYADMLRLRYHVGSELRANRAPYDLAKMAKYLTTFTAGRMRGSVPVLDDPYAVFAARWLATRHGCRVVYLVRHPAGIVASLKRIGTRWCDNLPDIAGQPELRAAYLSEFDADIDRTVGEPFDVVAHGCLLYRLIHSAIAQDAAAHPDAIVVRYEDLAGDPVPAFRDLYQRLGLSFGTPAEAAVRKATSPRSSRRRNPWGRVGLSKTAFQPMDSRANAWAWRERLSAGEQAEVIERTSDVASLFYTPGELSVSAPRTPAQRTRPGRGAAIRSRAFRYAP
jgi:hypothetical protein